MKVAKQRPVLKTSELLRGAACRLKEKGWRKHDFGRQNGPACMLGAMSFTVDEAAATYDVPNGILYEAVGFVQDDVLDGVAIPAFNDRHCHSVDDATAALCIAADLAEVKGR